MNSGNFPSQPKSVYLPLLPSLWMILPLSQELVINPHWSLDLVLSHRLNLLSYWDMTSYCNEFFQCASNSILVLSSTMAPIYIFFFYLTVNSLKPQIAQCRAPSIVPLTEKAQNVLLPDKWATCSRIIMMIITMIIYNDNIMITRIIYEQWIL